MESGREREREREREKEREQPQSGKRAPREHQEGPRVEQAVQAGQAVRI